MTLIIFLESIFFLWSSFNIDILTAKVTVKDLNEVRTILMDKYDSTLRGYWGALLAMSDEEKYKICEDIMKPFYWPITHVDGEETVTFPLSLAVLKVQGQQKDLGLVLTFDCYGIDRSLRLAEHTISYGYSKNTFFVSVRPMRNAAVQSYVIGTADYMIQPVPDLEQFYYDARLQIENLKLESPDYVKLIKIRDDISAKSGLKKIQLCESVFQSPYYEWRKVKPKKNGSIIAYKSMPLYFKNNLLLTKTFPIRVMICQVHLLGDPMKIFGLIPSYNNDQSLFVVAGTENGMYLDVYLKKNYALLSK